MITVANLAKQSDLTAHTVRHYTEIGLLKPVRNRTNGYHIYEYSDVKLLRFIKKAKTLGFSLKEIAHILDEAGKGKSPCPLVREIVEKRLVEISQQIELMKEVQAKIQRAQKAWQKMNDSLPDGHSVCHLIESIAE